MLDGLGLLPSVAYQAPQAGCRPNANDPRNKKQLQFAQLPASTYSSDVDEDNFPTPRGMPQSAASTHSEASSWRESCASFNSLYDVSDDDSEIVPLKLSNSIKKAVNAPIVKHSRLPSLVIPSPTAWPTIQKLKSKATAIAAISPMKTPLSPQALALLQIHNSLQIPGANATPSLDGSLTSDDITTTSSCTTPAGYGADNSDGQWEMPIQLDPQAMDTLLAFDMSESGSVVEVSEEQAGEMQSHGRSMSDVVLAAQLAARRTQDDTPASAIEPFSAISLPSPGGFFSSLDSPSKRVWAATGPQVDAAPNTSTAESFYGVPWSYNATEHVVHLRSSAATDGPPTARKDSSDSDFTTVDEMVIPIQRQFDYDDQYEEELHRRAVTNMSRTSLWLNQQDIYLAVLKSPPIVDSHASQTSMKSPPSNLSPRKSVRFVAEPQPQTPQTAIRIPLPAAEKPKADPLFYHAFQHLLATNSVETAYTHRHVRANALSTQRRYVADKHRRQLGCAFSLPAGTSVASARDFSHLSSGPAATSEDDAARAAIQAADRERQALDQLSLSVWALLATRYLASSAAQSLLSPPAAAILAANPTAKVLDLGGQPTADWAWALALEYRDAKVHTVLLDAQPDTSNWKHHRGPRNHRIHESPCAWSLPFPDATFAICSARTLHTLLRDNHGFDEWAATLAEIRRVLAPGGILCYEAMDAEISALDNTGNASAPPAAVRAAPPMGAALAARSAEFAVAVRQLGYSASAGTMMPQRLARAGFTAAEIAGGRRAWVSLPLAPASSSASSASGGVSAPAVGVAAAATKEAGVEAVTSLAGSVAWERWMLKLQREMGRPEERLLDGVGKALDEAGGSGGWRVLKGWVRKE